ncbi:efflux RND transporter permease subunit [bacterium]|nr:efflux RND transporter permease subunit [bacterium]
MFLARLAVDRPVLATVIILSLVVFGAFSFVQLSQELRPKVEFPNIVVTTVYPGAGPREVETQVTEKLEDELGTVAGLNKMESQSLENLSLIQLEFELDVDINVAATDVKDAVDLALLELPRDVEPPVVQQFNLSDLPILNVAVYSDRPLRETTHLADTRIKDVISRVEGVSKVEIIGGLEREILVAAYEDRLRAFGLEIADLVEAVRRENLNFPAGRVTRDVGEYALRMVGEFSDIESIRRLRIVTPGGATIELKDVADVRDAFEEPRELARFQTRPAVSIQVMKKDDANTVAVSDGVRRAVERLKPWLEREALSASIANDTAKYVRDAVNDALQNIIIGIVLTSLLLYLFLHDLRSTFIVALVMPASVVATFSLMYFADFTINTITLMALGICIGILVTNSIVVLENINNKIAKGLAAREAAIEGTGEIAVAVLASTMTNIVVFTPIAFMKGIIGRFFYQFGLTVVFATLVSLLISFTLTPMLANLFLKRRASGGVEHEHKALPALARFDAAWDRFYENLASDYRRSLAWCLRHRKTVSAATTLVFAGGIFVFTQVGAEFFPRGDEGIVVISAKLPPGTSLSETSRTLARIAARVEDLPEVDTILEEIGGLGRSVNEGNVTINLIDIERRERSTNEIADAVRPRLSDIPAAEIQISTSGGGGGRWSPIDVEITGPDLDVIRGMADEVSAIARGIPGVIDVNSTYESGKPELSFVPDRARMAVSDVSAAQIAATLRTGFVGEEVTFYREAGEDYDIRVQLAESERDMLENFATRMVKTKEGYAPLAELGTVRFASSELKIERKDKQRIVHVLGNVSGITTGEANEKLDAAIKQSITPPTGYELSYGGEAESMAKEFAYIFQALILAILLTYLVLAAILEDFTHPFTIMLTLPLGLIGVALALFIGKVSINLMSLMAIVMLVGIVVNNAILILDYVKQLRVDGWAIADAVIEASATRLRPIIMTNLAIAISVAPQALTGAGAEFRRALAVVTMGGVLVSAVFTLFLIPTIYSAFDRFAIKPKVEPAKGEIATPVPAAQPTA